MNIIALLHALFVVYMVTVPFVTRRVEFLWLHVALLVCLLVHWHFNNDMCALTLMEHFLFPETKRSDLFVQRLVGPVYKIQSHEIKYATYALLLFTLFRLFTLHISK